MSVLPIQAAIIIAKRPAFVPAIMIRFWCSDPRFIAAPARPLPPPAARRRLWFTIRQGRAIKHTSAGYEEAAA